MSASPLTRSQAIEVYSPLEYPIYGPRWSDCNSVHRTLAYGLNAEQRTGYGGIHHQDSAKQRDSPQQRNFDRIRNYGCICVITIHLQFLISLSLLSGGLPMLARDMVLPVEPSQTIYFAE